MKLFNVHLEVQISFAGELQEPPASEPQESFTDLVNSDAPGSDPVKLQAKLLDKLYKNIPIPSGPVSFSPYPGQPEGVSMSQNVKIAASSFEELQKVLARFHEVAESLKVPA